MRGADQRARDGSRAGPRRSLSAKPSVLLWLDGAAAYRRAAERAGLASSVDFLTVPLAADPPEAALARADALLAWRPPARLAQRAPRQRWIQSLTAGVEQWLAADLPANAALTCARGTHRLQMPEHLLAALFLAAKDLAGIVRDQSTRTWRRRVNPTLAGRTLGVLGLGAIGAELARKAVALEMRVVGTRRRPEPVAHVERVFGPDGVDTVLAESDYVVLLLPSTAETRGLMNAERLGRMKATAWLLNFGRGDLVVDDDLIDAVKRHAIAGAVLDVFRKEPLASDSPFWATDGIIIFPHVGGLHPDRDELVAALWVENLAAFVAGRPLREVIDPARGY